MRHAARLETSDRLQRVLALLLDGQWHPTRDIQNNAYVCAAGECVSELRAPINNIPVECKFIDGNYHYRLENLEYARQRYRAIKDGADSKEGVIEHAEKCRESEEVMDCNPAPISLMPLPSLEAFSEGRLF